jgi:hypothetical protein
MQPVGRVAVVPVETAEMAGAAVFLASGAADFITGVSLPVDGGYSMLCAATASPWLVPPRHDQEACDAACSESVRGSEHGDGVQR